MDANTRACFRRRLEADREKLIEEGQEKFSPNRTDDAGRRDEDGQPLNEMLQAITSQKNQNRSHRIRQIEETLKRIKEAPEEFGLCVECDEEIPLKRLELMPYASLCVGCQSTIEGDRTLGRRHLTDFN